MSKISDIIEAFILEQMQDDEELNLSRNELANFFNCAPSQINYVLSTRFTTPKGFIIESHRGGGGYIRLVKVNMGKDDYLNRLLTEVLTDEITYSESCEILDNLYKHNVILDETLDILKIVLSGKSLSMPIKIENKQRANILENLIINIIKESV